MQITAHGRTVLGVSKELLSAALDQAEIDRLVTPYWRVSVVELTSTTQGDLVQRVRDGNAQVGDVIAAEFQSAGRGRLDRTFEAAKGTALLFSFYIEPQRNRDDWGWIPLIAGYSVAKTLHAFHATVKWPNDILINHKKVSGLIAEVVGDGVVIGIGINVGMSENQLPVESATSLLVEGGVDLTRDEILCEVLEEFEDHFLQWDQGIDEVQALYVHLCATLGKEVRVEYPGGATHLAIAESISDIGALILDDGVHVQSADVIHLR
jgi:BirA family biotin operon repressor/biotin-[acetyl-CoA-carboxylase] ligase